MKEFQKILAIFDTEERDAMALNLASQLARNSGGQLTVVHVIPPLPSEIPEGISGLEDLKATMVHAAEATLGKAVGRLDKAGVPVRTQVCWGHTAMEVSRLVMTSGYDLVVKGTGRRKRLSGQLLGSVDMRLLRKCPCPVWLIKPDGHDYVRNVLAAVDPISSDGEHERLNELILRLGISLAEMEDAEFHALYAFSPWGESLLRSRLRSEQYHEYEKQLRARAAKAMTNLLRPFEEEVPQLNRHLLEGDPEDVVPEFVRTREVDVVVMGTVGRTGIPGFLIGNTAEKILADVECSVLAVKPEGFKSPVEVE
ncbi:MAG: universal stress protein [Gemmatimonadota bacterium]|jgi:nucleotide-binding universal stress UspA family protein